MIPHQVLDGNNGGEGEFFPQENDSNPPPSTPLPTGVPRTTNANIFYKTQMCRKFFKGTCRNGDECNFAHGRKDLRQLHPNGKEPVKDWNDDNTIIRQMGICWKFHNGEECPAGDRCKYLHENPAKFKAESAMEIDIPSESNVITIPTILDPIAEVETSDGRIVSKRGAQPTNSTATDPKKQRKR